jgi:hypothetical protein
MALMEAGKDPKLKDIWDLQKVKIPCFREFGSVFFIFEDRLLQVLPKIGEFEG